MARTVGVVNLGAYAVWNPRSQVALAMRRFGGKSLLEWVVRRISEAQHLEEVCVLTESSRAADLLRPLIPTNVRVVSGEAKCDQLYLLAQAARELEADYLLRVSLTHPFVDPVLLDRLAISAAGTKADFACYCFRDGRPALQSQLGVLADWFRGSALQEADKLFLKTEERSDIARSLLARPDRFNIRLCPLPAELNRDNMRLCLASEEDWDHAHAILEALGPEQLDWQQIASLLDHQPAMRERMADLNRQKMLV